MAMPIKWQAFIPAWIYSKIFKRPVKQLSDKSFILIKTSLFFVCLIPFIKLVVDGFNESLGVNPVETITRTTGLWALRLLLLSLAITPLQKWSGLKWLVRLRRIISLYCFFYAFLHFSTYLVFDQFFDWASIGKDIVKRPYITVGFLSFILLIPLAVTSTDAMVRWMGGRYWKYLHRSVYFTSLAAVFHYFWLVKKDVTSPAIYMVILIGLLIIRLKPKVKTVVEPDRSRHQISDSAQR